MYNNIVEQLNKNNIKFKDIFYFDLLKGWTFNNNEEYRQFVLDKYPKEQNGYYLILWQEEKERKFKIPNIANWQGIQICLLEEVLDEQVRSENRIDNSSGYNSE